MNLSDKLNVNGTNGRKYDVDSIILFVLGQSNT